jgi:hypothetical protein
MEFCNGGNNFKERIMVLLACNDGGNDKCSPLVAAKSENPLYFKYVRSCPQNM